MGKKKRINIYVDEDEWDKLQRNITCSRSEWINQMIIKQNQTIDEVEEINLQIESIENQEKSLSFDKKNLIERREEILKQREINEQRFDIVENAMSTIRKIVNNPERSLDYIELDRVKHIAKKNVLDYNLLVKQSEKEGIVIKDVAIVKEELRNMQTMRIS